MYTGFLLAVLTGFTWTAFGVVISRCARKDFDIVTYSMAQTLTTSAMAFLFYAHPMKIELRSFLILAAVVLLCGFLNSVAQMIVKITMERGNHGPVWAIAQSSLVIPFLAGIILFGNRGTVGQWCGTVLILCGILLPSAHRFKDFRQWLLPVLGSFFIFGIIQTLYALPSQVPELNDTAGMRPMLAAFGGFLGWEVIRRGEKRKLTPNKATLLLALSMAGLSVISLKIFFSGLDHLSAAGMGNIGFPLIVGSNILGFSLYSLFVLREHLNRLEAAGMLCVLAGIVSVAL